MVVAVDQVSNLLAKINEASEVAVVHSSRSPCAMVAARVYSLFFP